MSIAPLSKPVPVDEVLEFVGRTISHGVPARVAFVRAEKRFGVHRHLIRAFWRSV